MYMMAEEFKSQVSDMKKMFSAFDTRIETLKNLDLFVLDNSLRETTVGQLRGHTLENKKKIYEQVKRVGFSEVIIESFNHLNRVGESFIKNLVESGEDVSETYAFSELFDRIGDNKVPITNEVPIGLLKMKEYGIKHCVIEIDVMYYDIDYTKFTMEFLCHMLWERIQWVRTHLDQKSKIFFNIRDFPEAMREMPHRIFQVVHYLSTLPEDERVHGIAYEEGGKSLNKHLAVWTKATRNEMDRCGWKDGHLIVHIHEQFGMAASVNLECLANGANGIWAGLSEEGAAIGHASSCLTIINLIRMGNTKVLEKFNCTALRAASREVTIATTGVHPHAMRPVVGDRALDVVFVMDFLMKKTKTRDEFNLAEFLGEKPKIRLSNMTSPEMIITRLTDVFGEHECFTIDVAKNMQNMMLQDLKTETKEEYHSKVGLAMLFDRSGGKLARDMADLIVKNQKLNKVQENLLNEIRKIWDAYDLRDGTIDNSLTFDEFYDGFMSPHFGCYRCTDTRKALSCIDMDNDGQVEWEEFAVYLKWAMKEYPDLSTPEEVISAAFNKGIKPAMHDEILKQYGEDGDD